MFCWSIASAPTGERWSMTSLAARPVSCKVCHLTARNAFIGTPGEALRAADQRATECGVPVVYVRDDT